MPFSNKKTTMKTIILTSANDGGLIYINIQHIGHYYKDIKNTIVGVTTHRNGGFSVTETPEQIRDIICVVDCD